MLPLCLITPRRFPLFDMELELSLGDSLALVTHTITPARAPTRTGKGGHDLALGLGVTPTEGSEQDIQRTSPRRGDTMVLEDDEACPQVDQLAVEASLSCPLNLASAQTRSVNSDVCRKRFDVNLVPVDGRASIVRSLSPSSMQVEVPFIHAVDQEASDDEENGGGRVRKKLRLSKEQSAFLEDSFKEHSTLSLEQKSNLANRLNLRPRQVEVWFQNRRARTKLKQTEVDCEYLKRCCQTLTQENRRLQREVAELRAFRPTYSPYNHHLYGCPSCDNKAKAYSYPPFVTTHGEVVPSTRPGASPPTLFARPHFGPFASGHPVLRRQSSATS